MSHSAEGESSETTRQPVDADRPSTATVGSIIVTVLHHPDVARIGEVAVLLDRGADGEAVLSRSEPVFRRCDGSRTDALRLPELSRTPLVIAYRAGELTLAQSTGMETTVEGERLVGQRQLSEGELERGVVVVLARTLALLLHSADVGVHSPERFGMVGDSQRMRELRREVMRVADRDIPVLLLGETGVGKELVAAAIHAHSARKHRPYVCVNLAAVPSSVAEGELFGYAKGAFTGATSARAGYFADADGGTLFLDEVGDTPMDIQAKLLRVTQERVIQPLGRGPRKVDVRLIAATDSDLENSISRGTFRRPLLERLSGYRIRVPSLRERRDDIPRLFIYCLMRELQSLGEPDASRLGDQGSQRPWLPLSFMVALVMYPWPGNVRELANMARQLAIGSRGHAQLRISDELLSFLGRRDAALAIGALDASPSRVPITEKAAESRAEGETESVLPTPSVSRRPRRARDVGEEDVVVALRTHDFKIAQTAAALGITKNTLYKRMRASQHLRKAGDLTQGEIRNALDECAGDIRVAAAHLSVSKRALILRMKQLEMGR